MQPHGYDNRRRTSDNTEKIFRRFADNLKASTLVRLRRRYSRRTSLGVMLVATLMAVAVRGATPFASLDWERSAARSASPRRSATPGIVVGASNTAGDTTSHGFTWSRSHGWGPRHVGGVTVRRRRQPRRKVRGRLRLHRWDTAMHAFRWDDKLACWT